jgi:hypothetical protein
MVDIAPATSMTAAIATGLWVDFGIRLIAHARSWLLAGALLEEALSGQYLLFMLALGSRRADEPAARPGRSIPRA